MYNRYIPQADGTYRKNRVPDHSNQQRQQSHRSPPPAQKREPSHTSPPPPPEFHEDHPKEHCSKDTGKQSSAGSFLRQLLPKDLDTGDLLIVLLLLLMAGDCEDEKSPTLLTLALYLLM